MSLYPTIAVDSITSDNQISSTEARSLVNITGRVGNTARIGDEIRVSVNGQQYSGVVRSDYTFSITVRGSDLANDPDRIVETSILTQIGDMIYQTTSKNGYGVNTSTATQPTITLDAWVTGDDFISAAEANDVVGITGRVGGGAKAGDRVIVAVNNEYYGGYVNNDMTFTVYAYGIDLANDADRKIEATVYTSDSMGNELSATTSETYTVYSDTVNTPKPTITLDGKVTEDDIVSAAEAEGVVAIRGTVTNADAGDTIRIMVNNTIYRGSVDANGTSFTVNVEGSDLIADIDRTIEATLTTYDYRGTSYTATTSDRYSVNLKPQAVAPTITLDANITSDDKITAAEARGNVAITGSVGGGAKTGDTVSVRVNGKDYNGTVQSNGQFSINVAGSDLAADSSRTVSATVYSKQTDGSVLSGSDTETYQVDLSQPVTPTPPTTSKDAAVSITNVAGDGVVSLQEVNGNVTITGSVSGTAKRGDLVDVIINNRSYRATVDYKKGFSVSVAGSELAADADQIIEAKLSTKDASGKALTVSNSYQYGSVKNVSGTDVGDTGQSDVAYFIRSISTDSRQGYLGSPTTRYRDQQGNIKNGVWEGMGNAIEVSYSFATRAHGGEAGFKQYSATQKAAVRDALGEYEKYANVKFREVSDDGQANFRFYLDNLGANSSLSVSEGTPTSASAANMCTCCGGLHRVGSPTNKSSASSFGDKQFGVIAGYAYYGGDVHINGQLYAGDTALSKTTKSVVWNGYSFDGGYGTLVHEIGHSLGLKHTGNYNGNNGTAAGPYLPNGEENSAHSIMSYNESSAMTGPGLQIFDLAAIHYRFGVNRNENAGNNTYTFRAYNSRTAGNDVYIWDGAGVDTFDASAEKQGVTVDLTPGSWNYSGKKSTNFLTEANGVKTKGQSFIGYGTQIENLIGSAYNDNLKGNNADNNIFGGAGNDRIFGDLGNDTLDGGAGNDTYVFSGQFGQDTVLNSGGGSDTLLFEGISYSSVINRNGGVRKEGNDLVLTVSNSNNSVTVKNYFNNTTGTQTVAFSSGESVTASQINSLISAANNMVNAMAAFGTASATAGGVTANTTNNQPLLASSALGA